MELEKENKKKEWFVVNTVSGHEYKVKEKLEMRIETMGLQDRIFRVIVPEQKEIEYKDGVKKEKVKKKKVWKNKKKKVQYNKTTANNQYLILWNLIK